MDGALRIVERRTSADEIFEYLQSEIQSLRLKPGSRLSETEVAKQFGVSRQPVREAFIRLNSLDLLSVRPQRATLVRGFSETAIRRSLFIRLAIECEVVRVACRARTPHRIAALQENLAMQRHVATDETSPDFPELDLEFHRLLFAAAGVEQSFPAIEDCKLQVDRLCQLTPVHMASDRELLSDHAALAVAVIEREDAETVRLIRAHLGRLDRNIEAIRKKHAEFFED